MNDNSPCGGKAYNTFIAASFSGRTNKYITSASDATPIFKNDFVKLTGSCNANGVPFVTRASAGEKVLGTVIAATNIVTNEILIYREAYTEIAVHIFDDPFGEFEMQVNGILTANDIGKYADIIVAIGDSSIGISKTQLDLTTLSTDVAQIKLLGLIERDGNELGLYSHVRCMIAQHQLKDQTSESHGIIFTEPLAITLDDQTVFILTHTPISSSLVKLYLNGQRRQYLIDYTVSGQTLTWLNPSSRNLKITDTPLIVDYEY